MTKKPSSRRKKDIPASSSDDTSPDNLTQEENPASATITVTAVEVPELTQEEQSDRLHLERKVERAFFEAGKALMELRTSGLQILPTNERQVRPLVALEPEVQRTAWQQAVQVAGGKVPTGRIVKDVVQRIMERTQVPNTYQLGEVCQILAKDNPELRGKGGCWGIVVRANDFSCTVRVWDGEYAVGLQHLKSYNYLPAECQQIQVICDRISRVYSGALEESVQKLNRSYLSVVEEKLLRVLESEVKA
ncbi:hypothetical protein [Nostoc sp.]